MCNLYSITTNQAAIIALFRVVNRYVGNFAPMPGVFPDYPAPVVRNTDTGRELSMMRWGMPPPPRVGGPPVTNIRNTSSPHWRGWLKPENRCLVPFNSFTEADYNARSRSSGARSTGARGRSRRSIPPRKSPAGIARPELAAGIVADEQMPPTRRLADIEIEIAE
jgi:putative SOS response-associated peptidase YedK